MTRTTLILALLLFVNTTYSQETKTKTKRIEIVFMETKKIEDVTMEKGFKYGEGGSIGYLHKEPALVLSPKKIKKVELSNLDLSKNGLSANNYSVKIFLTEDAKKELASKVKGKEMKLVTFLIDGKRWGGLLRYEVDESKRGVPPQAFASTFLPTIGYFSDKAYAESIVDALK